MKYCHDCKVIHPAEMFNIKVNKNGKERLYMVCKAAEEKRLEGGKQKQRAYTKKHVENNRDRVNERNREYYKTDYYKGLKKSYYHENRTELLKRRNEQKAVCRKNLADVYVKDSLRQHRRNITPEMIDHKKTQIVLHRLKKIVRDKKHEI